ncbi:MAG TPA: hypothetical protein VK812_16165 [Candidatus Binatus sp.]|nr:hypothetical protein [Candidatus Binatus sp.]
MNRLSIALVCYVVLGALAWTTLTEPKLRAGTLVILALFAVKSVLRRNDVLHADKEGDAD